MTLKTQVKKIFCDSCAIIRKYAEKNDKINRSRVQSSDSARARRKSKLSDEQTKLF